MKTVNELRIRNNLGEILDMLHKTGDPIFVSKGREIRAVIIAPDQFKKRHLHAHQSVSFIHNPEAPFGLESFDPELTTEGLMAERKSRGHVLKGVIPILNGGMLRQPVTERLAT